MTPLLKTIVRMLLSAAVILLCVLSLARVLPPEAGVSAAVGVAGLLCIFNGCCCGREQRKGGLLLIGLGILLLIFAAAAPFLN